MKKILLLLYVALAVMAGCTKDSDAVGAAGRFELVDAKTMLRGNLVTGHALTDSNLVSLQYKNAPAHTAALISADTVNGLYVSPVTVELGGTNTVSLPLKGKAINDGTFVMSIKVVIDGTTYLCNKEFYVDEPIYTSITINMTDSAYYNITAARAIPFEVTPKTTSFSLALPAHLTADITNVSSTGRSLNISPDALFVKGDVVITATFLNLPVVVKTIHFTAFAGGDGTAASPFLVPDSARLNRIRFALDRSYKLSADIAQPVNVTSALTFSGTLDGSGFKITGNTVSAATTDGVGYFGDIAAGGVVKNLIFQNSAITGQDYTGSVAGANHGTISNVTVTGTVLGRTWVGGITGNNYGTITGCDVTNLDVKGVDQVATLAGKTNTGASQASNILLSVPGSFPTELYGVSTTRTVDLAFLPADGTISVVSAPANMTATAVSGQQKVTLTPQAGFISGILQLSLQKDRLSVQRNIAVYFVPEGSVFSGGDGSTANPYLIATATALNNVRNDGTKSYKIIADITLTGNWTPIPSFSGTLDGQGYKINNLSINSTTANEGFISTLTGTVKNIQFLNVNGTTTAAFGVVAGKNTGGLIQNVSVGGTVTSTNAGDVLGGIAGELNSGGKITQCITRLTMTASCGMTGGIAGRLTTATGLVSEISFCTTTGSITITASKNRIGGILGRAEGTLVGGGIIKNCVSGVAISSTGATATSANGMGGIFGADQNAGIVPIDQCMFTGSIITGFSVGGIAGVGSSISNCLVAGSAATPVLLSSTSTAPATGSVGGIAGTNKVSLSKCVVKNTSLRGVVSLSTLPLGGIVSTYQNGGYTTGSVVINTSIEGSNTAPNANNVYRVAGAAGGTPGNSANYAGPGVTAQFRTPNVPFTDDAAGLDGLVNPTITQSFLQGLGYDFTTIWKMDTDGFPALRNAGYNGSLPAPL